MTTDTLQDHLLNLEHAGWSSLCDGTGSSFFGELMTDDGLMVLANGQIMRRAEVVAALRDAPPWSSFDLDDLRVVHTGVDSAALVYVGRAWRDQEGEPFVAAMTSVYRRIGDGWRLALYQQTPVPAG